MYGHVGTDDDVTHDRMNAICAHDSVGVRARSIGKRKRDVALWPLIKSNQLFVQMDDFGRYGSSQSIVQIRAVHAKVRSAVKTFRHRQLPHEVSGVPLPV